ncbi:MAG: MBL fold metallo-hydrolase, partial [Acidobacteria bacterium]|nr:MBL fold metallo-hydrolase [Acidobacteriota bacterium]
MKIKKLEVGIAALLLAATVGLRAQQPPAAAEIESFHVQGNVWMLVGAGGNIAVQVGDEGVLVVDTGLAQNSEKVLAAIKKLSNKPIRWIINTHYHPDHTGGNEALAKAGAKTNGQPAEIIA